MGPTYEKGCKFELVLSLGDCLDPTLNSHMSLKDVSFTTINVAENDGYYNIIINIIINTLFKVGCFLFLALC